MTTHKITKKANSLFDDLIEVTYETKKGKGRGSGTTSMMFILPKELADLIKTT